MQIAKTLFNGNVVLLDYLYEMVKENREIKILTYLRCFKIKANI